MVDSLYMMLNPGILFFVLGVFASLIKSNLEIPQDIVNFITLYLMVCIGFAGGISLYTAGVSMTGVYAVFCVLLMSAIVPAYSKRLLTPHVGSVNAAAVGGTYGSNSTLTFVTAAAFLSAMGIPYAGYMTFALAVMELPAVLYSLKLAGTTAESGAFLNSLRDGTLVVLMGSMLFSILLMCLGYPADVLAGFRSGDMFTGFLMFFLLYMGLRVGIELRSMEKFPVVLIAFAVLAPLAHAGAALLLAFWGGMTAANGFLLMVLCSSSSYIVAPAVFRDLLPQANPSIYLTMSMAITFPLNISLGIPLYWWACDLLLPLSIP